MISKTSLFVKGEIRETETETDSIKFEFMKKDKFGRK